MITIINLGLTLLAGLLMVPLLTLLVQAVAAILLRAKEEAGIGCSRPGAAIVIPAHNEASTIAATVASVMEQISNDDRVVVVADNCSDNTAAIARFAGAEVVVREDTTRAGKGYALDAGIRHLARTDPREVVVIIDADCLLSPGALETLVSACGKHQVPVQALNIQTSITTDSSSGDRSLRIAEFAWRIKGVLRPTGYMCLGLPCHLMGTGMALPWDLLRCHSLATSHITEDIVLGVELALRGRPPRFCPHAQVTSEMPPSVQGRREQRERWIHGYLSTAKTFILRLIVAAFRHQDVAILALACDLAVPPLTILTLCCGVSLLASMLFYMATGAVAPVLFSAVDNVALLSFALLAWHHCGRDLISWGELSAIPRHLFAVARISYAYVAGRRSKWVRAERSN